MAYIQPTSNQIKQRYRAQLPKGLPQAYFDKLAKLMDMPRNDLVWHYDVGELIRNLQPEHHRGTEWLITLAKALGPSTESLQKSLRFVMLYPKRQALQELHRIGINWTRLHLSFPVKNLKSRRALLRKAVKKGWNDEQLRVTVQQKTGSTRRGVGGRPRKQPQNYGPEPTLRKLAQLNRAWLAFHGDAWKKVTITDWERLVRSDDTNDGVKLRDLLNNTQDQVTKLVSACQEVRKTLKLLQ